MEFFFVTCLFELAILFSSYSKCCTSLLFRFLRTDFVASGSPIQWRSSSEEMADEEEPSLWSLDFSRVLEPPKLVELLCSLGDDILSKLLDLTRECDERTLLATLNGCFNDPVLVSMFKSSNSLDWRRPLR